MERVCAEIMLKRADEIMMRSSQSHHDLTDVQTPIAFRATTSR